MAITVNPSNGVALVAGGTATDSFDVATDPDVLVAIVLTDGNNDFHAFGTVKVGGQTLTAVGGYTWGFGGRNITLYELVGPTAMSGAQDFTVQQAVSFNGRAMAWAIKGATAREGLAAEWTASGPHSITVDTEEDTGIAVVAVNKSGTPGYAPLAGTTEDYDDGGYYFGHETAAADGSRSVGWEGASGSHATGGIWYITELVTIAGERSGMEVGVRSGTLSYEGILSLPYRRIRGLLLGLRRGVFSFTAKRQVALVGGNLETAEMTEGGTEGQVLTQHTARKPTWEDAASGSSLDDLSDVTITAPAEGDLLRFDGTVWVNTTLRPEPMMASDGSVQLDSAGGPQMQEVAW